MQVRVRLFAMQREAAGRRELTVQVADGAVVEDAWAAAVDAVPALAPGRVSVRFAVNGEYADATQALADGDELACIPPVSGGSGEGRARILELRADPFDMGLATELAGRLATDEDGGVVTFVGRTRVTPGTPAPGQEGEAARHAGREVEELEYEAFEPLAVRVFERIAGEIEAQWPGAVVGLRHRVGRLGIGEASVVIAVATAHRANAFQACRYAIERVKQIAPIWKHEFFEDGAAWVEGAVADPNDDHARQQALAVACA